MSGITKRFLSKVVATLIVMAVAAIMTTAAMGCQGGQEQPERTPSYHTPDTEKVLWSTPVGTVRRVVDTDTGVVCYVTYTIQAAGALQSQCFTHHELSAP